MGFFSKLVGGKKKEDAKGKGKGKGKGLNPKIPKEMNPFILFDEQSYQMLFFLNETGERMSNFLEQGRKQAEEIKKDMETSKKDGKDKTTDFEAMQTRLEKIEKMMGNFQAFSEQLCSVASEVNNELGEFDKNIESYFTAAKKKPQDAADLKAKLEEMDRIVDVVANEGSQFTIMYGNGDEEDWDNDLDACPEAPPPAPLDESDERATPRGDEKPQPGALVAMSPEDMEKYAAAKQAEKDKKKEGEDFATKAAGRKSAIATRKSMAQAATGRKSVAVGRKSVAPAFKARKSFFQKVEDGDLQKGKGANKEEAPAEQEYTAEEWAKWQEENGGEGGEGEEEWTAEQWAEWEKEQAAAAPAEEKLD